MYATLSPTSQIDYFESKIHLLMLNSGMQEMQFLKRKQELQLTRLWYPAIHVTQIFNLAQVHMLNP